ncbi:MAG: amylo-alpha-1,6-glucosidase, partial [Bryobacteraceae bacterium]
YDSLPALTLWGNSAEFVEAPAWYRNIEYLAELDRGLEFREDQFTPGVLAVRLTPNQPWTLICAVGETRPETALPLARKHAADEFRVRRADGKPTIIAGYPWFTDWGRDTMIALPGLLLTRGRKDLREEAKDIIQGFLASMDRGLIPNRFPDAGETPEYNTCDGTLWMFQAVHAYEQAGGDPSFFFDAAREILAWHMRGTHYDIGVDPSDHLLRAGSAGTQLTWMDAKVGDWVVTPRHGKPVEINALWYNALKLSAKWLADSSIEDEAERVAASFRARFWNASRGCLFDVLDGDPAVAAKLRPNQVLAVSLPYSPLPADQQKAVVRVVEQELLTPFGLRTLDRNDPDYKPHYGGAPVERDGAYHQGTVWPWLMGPFVEAYLRAFGRSAETLAYARSLLGTLESEFGRDGLGSLAEVFDAENPQYAGGCPAQAWSVSEWLRASQLCKR